MRPAHRHPRCRACPPTSPSASSTSCAGSWQGARSAQIATELLISPSTVHTHTVHIYGKCEVSTRAALAMFAMQHGLAADGCGPSRKIH